MDAWISLNTASSSGHRERLKLPLHPQDRNSDWTLL